MSGQHSPDSADPGAEQRILDAARRVFTRHGTSGARVQQIADEAGVNHALVHYYFRSKERLAERVFAETANQLVNALLPSIAAETTIERLIERFVAGYVDLLKESPFAPTYVMAEAVQHPERLAGLMERAVGSDPSSRGRLVIERVGALIDEAVAAGRIRPIEPRMLIVNVVSMVVFPFAGRQVLMALFGIDDAGFDRFIEARRRELPGFILDSLRP